MITKKKEKKQAKLAARESKLPAMLARYLEFSFLLKIFRQVPFNRQPFVQFGASFKKVS